MNPPDLGGGQRRSRRPGLLFTCFFLLFLLSSSPTPPPTPDQVLLGYSDFFIWVRLITPLGLRSAIELHLLPCSCVAGLAGHRSEVKEPLMFNPNARSDPFSSPFWRLDIVFVRRCSPFCNPKKSTNVFFSFLSVGHSTSLWSFNPTGDYPSRCPPSQGRTYPDAVRIFYHPQVTQLAGQYVSATFSSLFLDEPFSELSSHDKATNFTDSTTSVTKSETYRKQGAIQAAAHIFQSALGRTVWILGRGPKLVTVRMPIRMGLGPNCKIILKEIHRSLLGFSIVIYGLLLLLKIYSNRKMGLGFRIESLDSYSPKM